jgi:cytidylate kinase
VAAAIQLPLYDDSKLKEEALAMGLHSEQLKGFDEKAPGFFDSILTRKPEVYLDLMQSVIFEMARRGEGVIVGHGSQVLLQDFDCALHVLIQSTMEDRIRRLMDVQGLSQEAAARLIHKSDNEKRGFFQFAFHKDSNDPSLYDLCITTAKIGVEQASHIIIEMVRAPETKTCSLNAVLAMERLSQKKRVEAALIEKDVPLALLHVEVPEKGVAHLSGAVATEEDRRRIQAIASAVAGISQVRMDVSVARAYF